MDYKADDLSSSTSNQPRHKMIKIIVGVVAAAIGVFAGSRLAQQGMNGFQAQQAAQQLQDANWETQVLGAMSLETPAQLTAQAGFEKSLPPQTLEFIEAVESYATPSDKAAFFVFANHFVFKEGVPISLDGAIAGGLGNAATAAGDADPKYTVSTTTISGLNARRGSYRGQPQGKTLLMEGAVLQRDHEMWQVQILFFSEKSLSAAERILQSIRIAL